MAGLATSGPTHDVWKTLQPPRSGGLRFDRRASTDPQSVATISTLMPSRPSRSAVTRLIAWVAGRSVGLMMTTVSPA